MTQRQVFVPKRGKIKIRSNKCRKCKTLLTNEFIKLSLQEKQVIVNMLNFLSTNELSRINNLNNLHATRVKHRIIDKLTTVYKQDIDDIVYTSAKQLKDAINSIINTSDTDSTIVKD
jgi:ribosomal 50S subunit-recycling heat shock protein